MSTSYRLQFCWQDMVTEVLTDARDLCDALAHIYGPFVIARTDATSAQTSAGKPFDRWHARLDGKHYSYDEFEDAVLSLEFEIERRLLKNLRWGTLIHAGAVTDGNRTIIVAGPSGTGKTTMSLELVRRGFRYLTDEFVALSDDGALLHPFPRAATLKRSWPHAPPGDILELNAHSVYRGFFAPASCCDLQAVTLDAPEIIFLERSSDGRPHGRTLTNHEKLTGLICSTFELKSREKAVWPAISALAVRSKACTLEYRELQSDLDCALQVLEQ